MMPELPWRDDPAFTTLLPHGPLLSETVVLLSTPRPRRPDLALGSVWEVTPANVEACSADACVQLARRLEGLLRGLPEGAALQALMTIRPATTAPAWEALRQGRAGTEDVAVHSQLAALRQGLPHHDGLAAARLRQVTTLVTLRLPLGQLPPSLRQRLWSTLLLTEQATVSLRTALTQTLGEALDHYERRAQAVEETLHAAGLPAVRLREQALCQALQQSVAPHLEAPGVWSPGTPLRQAVLTRPVLQVPGGWQLEELTARVVSMRSAPAQTYPGMLSAPRAPGETAPLALWDAWPAYPVTLAVNVAVPSKAAELERLRQKRLLAFFQARTFVGDTSPEHAAMKEELDSFLRQSFLEGTPLLWTRLHVVLWGPAALLAQGEDALLQAGRRLGLELLPEPILGSTLFLQTLPLGFDPAWPEEKFLRRTRRLPASNVVQLLPLYGGVRGTATPTVLYLNQRGETVHFDPFDSPTAPHLVVLGTSGSGKSFTVAHVLQQVLPLDATVVILDRWASYDDLCAAWGGRAIRIHMDDPVCVNPFAGPLDRTHRAFVLAVLAEMASGGDGQQALARDARAFLGETLSAFAAQHIPGTEPTLSAFAACLRAQDDPEGHGRRLARLLTPYYGDGPYAGFFDGPTAFTLHPTLTIVELSQLRAAPDLQAVLMLVLLQLVTQCFADPARLMQRKFLISDEAWALLKHETSAQVLEEVARTFRKLGTCGVFISQQVSDFATPAGKAIRDNAGSFLLLQQHPDEVERMRAVFDLSDQEVALLKRVHRRPRWSEAYLRLPHHSGGLIRLVPDPFLRWLVSQVPQERAQRMAMIARYGGDVRRAVAELAAQTAEEE